MTRQRDAESVVREIRRRSRKKYSAEEKIRIVLEGLRGEDSISEICRREGETKCFEDCKKKSSPIRPTSCVSAYCRRTKL